MKATWTKPIESATAIWGLQWCCTSAPGDQSWNPLKEEPVCLCISWGGANWDEGRKQGGRPLVDRKTRGVEASIWEDVKGKVVRGGTVKVRRWKERIIRWNEHQRGWEFPSGFLGRDPSSLLFPPWISHSMSVKSPQTHTHSRWNTDRTKVSATLVPWGPFPSPTLSWPWGISPLRNTGTRSLRLTQTWGRRTSDERSLCVDG